MSPPPYTLRQYRKAVGDVLKQLRTEAGITQEEAAAQLGWNRTHLSELESGHNDPRSYRLAEFAAFCELTYADLMARIEQRALWRAARSRSKKN